MAFPYFVLFEWAAPIVEFAGYLLLAWLLIAHGVRADVALLFLLVAVCFVGNTIWTQPKSSAIGLLLVAAGVPIYFRWRKSARIAS